ncbi:MAG: type I restriction enzyme HsdR N-terminal domain-containing protein [Flavihumibacter sp.]
MIQLAYPHYQFRLRRYQDREQVFDSIRKKWVALTPEEWVRQHFVQYLLQTKEYPAGMIAIEKKIMLGERIKRFDILVYDNMHKPWLMVECKGADIELNDDVMHQLLRYNMAIPVPFLVITNGAASYFFERTGEGMCAIAELPVWK